MVLLDRIELSTSPLPMECSTTELQQRKREGHDETCSAQGSVHRLLPQAGGVRKANAVQNLQNAAKIPGALPA
jgi:hypothetical protein